MSLQLRLLLIIFSIIFFFFVLYMRKSKMNLESSCIWVAWSLGVVLIAFFPEIIGFIGMLLGIAADINTVFLVMIFLLYVLVFLLYVKISLIEERFKELVQKIALKD